MFLAGGKPWEEWNRRVREAVIARQEKTGCARGSWFDAIGTSHARTYGRTLDTAWAVLTLEVYYRYANVTVVRPLPAKHVDASASPEDR